MSLREAAEMALEFCEFLWREVAMNDYAEEKRDQVETALRDALAEAPKVEAVVNQDLTTEPVRPRDFTISAVDALDSLCRQNDIFMDDHNSMLCDTIRAALAEASRAEAEAPKAEDRRRNDEACEAFEWIVRQAWNADPTMPDGMNEKVELVRDALTDDGSTELRAALTDLKAWKDAVHEALVINWAFTAEHEDNPRKAVADLIAQEVRMALDPLISSDAQALIDRGRAEAPKAEACTYPDCKCPIDKTTICVMGKAEAPKADPSRCGLSECRGKNRCERCKACWPDRESVAEALAIVESYGQWGPDLNDAYRRQIVLADEVRRLQGLYEMAVQGRADMRSALRKERDKPKIDLDELERALVPMDKPLSVRQERYEPARVGVEHAPGAVEVVGHFVLLKHAKEYAALRNAAPELLAMARRLEWILEKAIEWDEVEHKAFLIELPTLRGPDVYKAIDAAMQEQKR